MRNRSTQTKTEELKQNLLAGQHHLARTGAASPLPANLSSPCAARMSEDAADD